MLKLSAELTTEAMRSFPRAPLSACTHIARVLGIHCIAKRVQSAAAGRWLAVAGVDYLDPSVPPNRRCHHDRRGCGAATGFVVGGGRGAALRHTLVSIRVACAAEVQRHSGSQPTFLSRSPLPRA
jgi:hypothetical protein